MSEFKPSVYQQGVFDFISNGEGNAVVSAVAGSGKCLGFDTEILMYDGSIKKVQDIKVGDILMGDDSTPRNVLSTMQGFGDMRRIVPKKGDSWCCNDVHILTLDEMYRTNFTHKSCETKHRTVDISVQELEQLSKNKKSTCRNNGDFINYKLLRTEINFLSQEVEIDPWLYGIWLGDGSTNAAKIHNIDKEIIDEIKVTIPYGNHVSVKVYKNKKGEDKCPVININGDVTTSSPFRKFISSSSINNEKFIKKEYLINDKETRLKLLAGLVDSDGNSSKYSLNITTKFDSLAKNILFLCRSLGFAAYDSYKPKKCCNTGVINYYHSISISGDLSIIPVKLKRKKRPQRQINKNVLHTGFRIEKIKKDNYYGFEIDGNKRFVLGDFTVTHNTTTIVNALNLIDNKKRVLFVAFNKSIVEELKNRIKGDNIEISTLHSLGLRFVKDHLKYSYGIDKLEVKETKYKHYIKEKFEDLLQEKKFKHKQDINIYKENLYALIDYARFYLCDDEDVLYDIADKHSLILVDNECEVALKVIEWGKEIIDVIDYTDMIYLPNALDLRPTRFRYDFVFIDECQDLNVAQRELFLRCFKKNARFVAVGDEKQAIYGFTGSDQESFQKLLELPNTIKLPLSISYRCPKKVIELAKKIVPEIEHREDALDGEIIRDVKIKDIGSNDMVLCRSTKPLVILYMKLLKKQRAAYIKGRDIGSNMIRLIETTEHPILNNDLKSDGVFIRLYKELISNRNKLMLTKGLDEDEATMEFRIVNMYDMIKAMEILSEGLTYSHELTKRIEKVFSDDSNGIMLSTIHKAKGLEADNVYILCPSILPSPLAIKPWEKTQEKNLEYVAYTRAKKLLGFIDEKEIGKDAAILNVDNMVQDLRQLTSVINVVINKQYNEIKMVIEEPKVVKLNGNQQPKRKVKSKKIDTNKLIDEHKRKLKRFETLILNKTIDEAYEIFNDLGLTNTIRPTKRDGQPQVVTCDLKMDRLNVEMSDGLITKIIDFG